MVPSDVQSALKLVTSNLKWGPLSLKMRQNYFVGVRNGP